jgi:flavin-dependent dehydrogenase
MCIGDAHRFVDPIFSFGMFLSMTEASFAAKAAKAYIEGADRDAANPFRAHQLRVEEGIDVLEDMIDTFWEHSLPFATFAHHRYRDDLIDLFAGRIFERQPSVGTTAFRRLLHRERNYDSDGRYSVPIGSRYRPEDAPVWSPKSEVESTESWMGPR